MKTPLQLVLSLFIIMGLVGCKKNQIADDSACPNCPAVIKIDPNIAQEGNEVTITGQRFGTDKSKITLEILTEPQKVTIQTTDINSVTDTEIKFKVPSGKQGSGKVVVKVNVGTDILASDDVGIDPKPADIIFSFKGKVNITNTTPLKGRVGETATIVGLNFGGKKEDIKIKIGSFEIPSANISTVSETEIKFTIPPLVPETGAVALSVGSFTVSGALNFEYSLPKVTSTALAGKVGEVITLTGQYFGAKKEDISLKIGSFDIAPTNITSVADGEIKFTLPRGVPATGAIVLKVIGYASKENVIFQYNLPKITSTALIGAKDEVVSIAGVNLGTIAAEIKVLVGTIEVPVQTVTNAEVKVKIPKGLASGKVTIKVLDYEAKEKPEFLYKLTATVKTIFQYKGTTLNGGWVMDNSNSKIYFGANANSNNTADPKAGISLFTPNVSANTGTFTFIANPTTNTLNYAQMVAHSQIAYIPTTIPASSPTKQGLSQVALADNVLSNNAGSITSQVISGNATDTEGKINSLGIRDAVVAYLVLTQKGGNPQLQIMKKIDGIPNWGTKFTPSVIVSNIESSTMILVDGLQLFIPTGGGIMKCSANDISIPAFFAGTANAGTEIIDGPITTAKFSKPWGIVKGANDSFFLTDGPTVRWISKNTDGLYFVSTIAGKQGGLGSSDGIGDKASFNGPTQIFIDKDGVLFVVDNNNKSLRTITLE